MIYELVYLCTCVFMVECLATVTILGKMGVFNQQIIAGNIKVNKMCVKA